MDVWQGLIHGFLPLLNPFNLLLLIPLMIWGMIVGFVPGIGIMVAWVLLMPFLAQMKVETALVCLIGCGGGAGFAGAICAILIGIPGEDTNVATIPDGYPMTKKGQAGRAIGAMCTGSIAAGLFSTLMAILLIPVVMWIVKFCGIPEQCAMILVGVSFVGVIGGRSPAKGLMCGLLGFLLGFVGYQENSGVARYIFGDAFLYGGVSVLTVIMGLWAVPAVIDLIKTGGIIQAGYDIPRGKVLWQQMLEGGKDVLRHWAVWLRSVIIGFIIGVIPALGANTAIWMAYGQAAKTSKHPELFGTGMVEGVIAPESARSAVWAGAALTTLSFGIPGSAGMVIILAAFIMLGITPGPTMLFEHTDLCFLLYWTHIATMTVGLIMCLLAMRLMMRIVSLKVDYLFPIIGILVTVGAWAYSQNMQELVVLLVLGTMGYLMRKFGYPAAATLLGFVLCKIFERTFYVSLDTFGPVFLLRPIVLVLLALVVYVIFSGPLTVGMRKLLRRA